MMTKTICFDLSDTILVLV